MKKINIRYSLIIFTILACTVTAITSCTKDRNGEDPVVLKTTEDYQGALLSLVSSEKVLLDTCIIGYNKFDFKVASTANFTPYKTAYKTVLDTAYARLNRPGITIAATIALDKTLSIPGKNFRDNLFLSDRRVLNDSIAAEEAFNASVIVGTGPGQVLQGPKTTFTSAITAAKSTRDAAVTIDRQIPPAIQKLDDAEAVFRSAIIPATIGEYQTKAKAFVASEKTFVQAAPVGYDKDNYNITQHTAYLNALLAAEPVVNNPASTYTDISTALGTLGTPGNAFYASKFICDRRPLNDSIIVAQTLNSATAAGTLPGQVPAAAKTTFTTAINTAITARDKATTNEGQVKAAIYNLGVAQTNFEAAIIKK
jgi:hypothetical protein